MNGTVNLVAKAFNHILFDFTTILLILFAGFWVNNRLPCVKGGGKTVGFVGGIVIKTGADIPQKGIFLSIHTNNNINIKRT